MSMKKFFYRVVEGDSVLSIAKINGVTPNSIITQNALKEEISVGDLLYIEAEDCTLYSVKPHDTVDSVCKKFGVPKEKLLGDNGVDYLFYGLIIKI